MNRVTRILLTGARTLLAGAGWALVGATFGACCFAAPGAPGMQAYRGKVCVGPDLATVLSDRSKVTPECKNVAHVKKDTTYFLNNADTKTVYLLSGYKKAKQFRGLDVIAVGTLDAASGTLYTADMYRGLPPKIMGAKSLYIDCNSCVRAMSSAWQVAFEELTAWGRFDVTPDADKANLVMIISSNPYMGDYVKNEGTDTRPVYIKTVYIDVIDPVTGVSLWGDSKELGSWLIPKATRDLISEFKTEVQREASIGGSAADAAGKT